MTIHFRPLQAKRTRLCIAVARRALADFSKHRGVVRLPIPVFDLVAWFEFQVVPLFDVPEEFSAIVSPREKLIGVNGRHHRHRQRFSVCHELAHVLMEHPPESQCTSNQIMLYNVEADECAAELLMPSELLEAWSRKTRNTAELSRVFDVSVDALGRKLAQLPKMP